MVHLVYILKPEETCIMDFHLALPRWLADQRLDKEAKLTEINKQNKQQLCPTLDTSLYILVFYSNCLVPQLMTLYEMNLMTNSSDSSDSQLFNNTRH